MAHGESMDPDEHVAWALKHWNGKNQTLRYDTWIVVYENVSEAREMVWHPRRIGIIIFGAVLASWIVASNILLAVTLFRKRKYARLRPVNWLVLNMLVAEFLTGTFVVPLNVKTERDGEWAFGPELCRGWLLAQVLLAALTLWSTVVITLDRFIYALSPHSYGRRMSPCRLGALVLVSWMLSAATVVPPAVSMHRDGDFVFEEVCAMSVTREYAFGVSFASFFAPAGMLLVGTLGIIILAIQARSRLNERVVGHDAQALCRKNDVPGPDQFLDSQSLGNVALTAVATNVSVVALWCPFYVLNVMIPFCEGMCVDPNLWSLCVWLGYASAGITPSLWFLDKEIRQQYKELIMCRRDAVYYDEDDAQSSGSSDQPEKGPLDSNINIFKPYLFLKQDPPV